MKREMRLVAVAIVVATLGACAGGGGEASPGPESLAPVNTAYADAKARAAQCFANPTQACLMYEIMYGEECKILPTRCRASVLLWEKFPPDESNTSTLPNFIVDPSNPDTANPTGQTTGYPAPFTSWETSRALVVSAGGPLGMAVVNQSADGTRISPTYVGHGKGSVILDYDPSGQLREFGNGGGSFATRPELTERYGQPGIDAAWSTTTSQQTAFTAVNADGVALVANPYVSGWNYQSFGVWSHPGTPATEYVRGISFGAATPGPAIPTSGDAIFTGKLAGMYVSSAGEGGIATANLGVHVDFGTRSLSLASTGTMAHDGSVWTPRPGLDVNGTLSYSPGSGRFSGTLVNAAGTMSGTSNGQFYGPVAQELGGEFVLKSATTAETFVGAYGAKR